MSCNLFKDKTTYKVLAYRLCIHIYMKKIEKPRNPKSDESIIMVS